MKAQTYYSKGYFQRLRERFQNAPSYVFTKIEEDSPETEMISSRDLFIEHFHLTRYSEMLVKFQSSWEPEKL